MHTAKTTGSDIRRESGKYIAQILRSNIYRECVAFAHTLFVCIIQGNPSKGNTRHHHLASVGIVLDFLKTKQVKVTVACVQLCICTYHYVL